MKKVLLVLIVFATFSDFASATLVYWDRNGATPGAGGPTPTGTWDTTTANWNTDSTGASATTTFTNGDVAAFAAGTDATGSYAVGGSVTASAAGGGLTIEEGAVEFTGTITLGANPIVVNSGATLVQNSSARLATTAGSVYTINGGTVRSTNAGDAGSFIDLDSTISIGALGATLRYAGGVHLNIINPTTTISGSGQLTLEAGTGAIGFAGAATHTGGTVINSGEIRLRSGANKLPTGATLTTTVNSGGILNLNDQDQTLGIIAGNGRIGLANKTLTINSSSNSTFDGTIEDTANIATPNAPSALTGGKLTKQGTGTLTLTNTNTYTGTTTITGGTIAIGNNSALGTGTVTLNGGGLAASGAARTIANNAIINANSNVSGSNNLTINGSFTNSGGNRVLTSTNTFATILGGNVFLSEAAGTGRTLTLAGTGGSNPTFVISGNVANFNGAGTAGNIQVGNGSTATAATLTLAGNNTHSGATQISTLALLNIGSAGALGTSTLTTTGNGLFDNTTGGPVTLSNNIALSGGSPTFVGSNDLSFGNNTVAMSGASRSITTTAGTLTVGSITEDAAGRSFSKNGAGTLVLLGNSTHSGSTNVNAGTMHVAAGGSISNTSAVNVTGTLTVDGSVTTGGTVTINPGGTIGGAGTVSAAVAVNGGTVAPGSSPGTLTISNSLTLNPASELAYELVRTTPGQQLIGGGVNDLIDAVTNLTLDGTLNVAEHASFLAATPGDRWRLITYTQSLSGPGLGLGAMPTLSSPLLSFTIDTSMVGQVDLLVTAVPEAGAFVAVGLVSLLSAGAVWLRKRGASHMAA